MLSDEEKAIEMIEHIQECNTLIGYGVKDRTILAKALLNLIEKQSKEIEELKNNIHLKEVYVLKTNDYIKGTNVEDELCNKNWQDKIKEILGIEEDIDNEKLLSLLQTIVDENARLEEIEDRKVQIEYNNVFNKGVKSVEDKIKAKIEEVQDIRKHHLAEIKNIEVYNHTKQLWLKELDTKYIVLQSLLEKE